MDGPWKLYAKQHESDKYCMILLNIWKLKTKNTQEKRSVLWLPEAEGGDRNFQL